MTAIEWWLFGVGAIALIFIGISILLTREGLWYRQRWLNTLDNLWLAEANLRLKTNEVKVVTSLWNSSKDELTNLTWSMRELIRCKKCGRFSSRVCSKGCEV